MGVFPLITVALFTAFQIHLESVTPHARLASLDLDTDPNGSRKMANVDELNADIVKEGYPVYADSDPAKGRIMRAKREILAGLPSPR